MVTYICAKFHENILDGIEVKERTPFLYEKFQRAIITQKNVGGVKVLFLCTSNDSGLYLYKLS